GGQIPNNLALKLHRAGVKILGTSVQSIDRAESRDKFSALLDSLSVDQPEWKAFTKIEDAFKFADKVGYPVLVRPSYVLSGAAMRVAHNHEELQDFLGKAVRVNIEAPVVISKFLVGAREIEMDAVAHKGRVLIYAISEHVEDAGVHSGDATIVLPPQRTYLETLRRVKKIGKEIARSLNITGPFNIQFLAKDNQVMVIECNLRASRSFPFVSKVLKQNFIDAATRVMMGRPAELDNRSQLDLDYVGVKAPQFSFTRLEGADPTLGVEMASTGEVACLGWDFDEAFLKALIAVGFRFPIQRALLSTGPIESKAAFLDAARRFVKLGVELYATQGTADFFERNGVKTEVLQWPLDGGSPNAVDYIKRGKIDLVINIPKHFQKEELTNDYIIRRTAVDFGVPLITNRQLAERLTEALERVPIEELKVRSWRMYER
ncbi:MAG: ATP-grasp domain-containing protein, partial [Candidatus Krumholzibacteria bacterium]|nr:ATP-grasp domain-containing protein [Candidatus Krumholzibacteria bacterium]